MELMDDPDALERLTARIEKLESRIASLEHLSQSAASVLAEAATAAELHPISDTFSFAQDGRYFAVLGKAMLGIAGGYLLRAVAESGSVPKLAMIVLALAYAGTWLVWAARVPDARFASTVYAATASLILAPMLWELTLRFEVLPSWATAGILAVFVVSAYALAWQRRITLLVWVTTVVAVITALALMMVTHDVVPFVVALLLMALASEVAAARDRWLGLRPVIAVAADLAVFLMLYAYSRPAGIPPGYKPVDTPLLLGTGVILFLIYGGNTVFRTMGLRHKITVFEIGQTCIAFVLAAAGVLCFSGSAGVMMLGTFCLLLSVASYAAAYHYFNLFPEQRNYHVYGIWAAALFGAGSFLCLPPLLLVLVLSVAAIVATLLGVGAPRLTLEFHGLAYLAAAAYASGLLDYATRALAGTFPTAPGWSVWIVAASSIACYAVEGRFRVGIWTQRFLHLLSAILAVSAVITFLVSVLVWLAALGMTAGASQIAVIRTLITCLIALVLAFSSSRWQRSELLWIAYGILALVAAKLLFEDLQHGNAGCTAASIFLYAVALIFVPRLARAGRRPTVETAPAAAVTAVPEQS
jgi:hypothetical protein